MLFIKTNQQGYQDNSIVYYFEGKPLILDILMLKRLELLTKNAENGVKIIPDITISIKQLDDLSLLGLEIKQDRRKPLVIASTNNMKMQCFFSSKDFEGKKIHKTGLKIVVDNYKNYLQHREPIVQEYKLAIERDLLRNFFHKDIFMRKEVLESHSKMRDFIFNKIS